jgi:Protein of unknown function (DUF3618)
MDQTADQIEEQIDRTRDRLGSNLDELKAKFESAIDWREHLRAHPRALVGAAFVGGALLAMAVREPRGRGSAGSPVTSAPRPAVAQVRELWDDIQTALIGVAGNRLTALLGEVVPDFDTHYRNTGPRHTSRSTPTPENTLADSELARPYSGTTGDRHG